MGSIESDVLLTDEQVEEIRVATQALVTAIREADELPGAVRRVLMEHAEAILRAISVIELIGPEALIEERDRLEGHVRRQPATFVEAIRNSPVGAALIGLSLLLSSASGTVHEALQLTEDVVKIYEIVGPHAHQAPKVSDKQLESPGTKTPSVEEKSQNEISPD